MTGQLWMSMIEEINNTFGVKHVSFELMQKLSKITKAKAPAYLKKVAGEG